jgi:hypothetical protein
MAFNPGGSSTISAASDVAFSNPLNQQVLGYNSAVGKWQNQVLKKELCINVKDAPYNAKGDGTTDDTVAIQTALNVGGSIFIPAGTYIHTGLTIPSNTHVFGAGMKQTTLRIKNGTAWNNWSITNKDHAGGTTKYWSLSDMTVDGNQPNRIQTGGSGNYYGTNISIAHSEYVWINNVESIRAMQHCFDVTSYMYLYGGDGVWSSTPSRYVWFNNCRADLHGDDGFTTHGSEYIWFDQCWAGGTWKETLVSYTNSNGFEIDDGSRHVWMTDCYAEQNAHGFEVKAHGNVPAAYDVHLNGCVATKNQVNFSIRHIGHHVASDPYSLTAKWVTLTSCTSLYPVRVFTGAGAGDADDDSTLLRSLSIGAYRGVTCTGFTAIGDPTYDYLDSATVVFEFRSENIVFTNFHIEGFASCTHYDIYSKGGDQPAKYVTISNGTIRDSAINGIQVGSAAAAIINGVTITRTVAGSPNGIGVQTYGGGDTIRSNRITGFTPNYNKSGILYDDYETPLASNTTL